MKSSRLYDFYIINIWVDGCYMPYALFVIYMIHASCLNLLDSFQQKMEKKTSTFFHPSFLTCCQGAEDDADTEAQASCVILKHMENPHISNNRSPKEEPLRCWIHPPEVLTNGSTEAMMVQLKPVISLRFATFLVNHSLNFCSLCTLTAKHLLR